MNINNLLAKEFDIKPSQVESAVKLMDDGCTVPFIARYRKEATGGLSDVILRDLEERLKYIRNLESRKEEVIKSIEEQGKLTEKLKADIVKAQVLQKVEDLYRPFKQKRSTRASKAKERGLEPLSELIMTAESVALIKVEAQKYINEELEVNTIEDAIEGAKDIIAEIVSDSPVFREWIRDRFWHTGKVVSEVKDEEADEKKTYEMYYEYFEDVKKIANHRILALNRGEKEKILKVKVDVEEEPIKNYLKRSFIKTENEEAKLYLQDAIDDSYKRLISTSVEREIRNMLKERAEEEAIKVFGKNTKPLLMVPPVKDVRVLAIDPSYRTGCKIAALDETGKLLEYTTIYPNEPRNEVEKSKEVMASFIRRHNLSVVSIGNGTASRETEMIVAEMIKNMKEKVYYTIVSEAGASVYSASKLANEEYPNIDVSIRGAISIGRRLQDPLAELVKIDPKSIGVGQYQHDLNQTKLGETLSNVVEDCVNSVGVDLNTASVSLLNYISGINNSIAKNIVAYRDENGKFEDRKELKKVKRLGAKAFEQCAGFLRISDGKNPLDNTSVHPESYKAAESLMKKLGFTKEDITNKGLSNIDELIKDKLKELSEELEIGEMTLEDIIKELKKPGRDPREEMVKPVFRSDVLKMEDLKPGMIMTGTVRNVVDFGAFVDIGVKQDGLVHISELADKFIKNPMDVVSVGDNVDVKIIDIDLKRQKIALSIKQAK